ncbi:hypothetical protein [Marinobacterium lacunae]|nr:hypothetical protein [Marinobacterium lacunae]
MKEFMYAMALCLVMAAGWSASKAPGAKAIAAAANAEEVARIEQERKQVFMLSGGALVLALVCGVVGWRSTSREDPRKKDIL